MPIRKSFKIIHVEKTIWISTFRHVLWIFFIFIFIQHSTFRNLTGQNSFSLRIRQHRLLFLLRVAFVLVFVFNWVFVLVFITGILKSCKSNVTIVVEGRHLLLLLLFVFFVLFVLVLLFFLRLGRYIFFQCLNAAV